MPLQNIQPGDFGTASDLFGFAQNIRSVSQSMLFLSYFQNKQKGRKGRDPSPTIQKTHLDFIQVIVHSIYLSIEPININAVIFKYNKRLLAQMINNAVIFKLL